MNDTEFASDRIYDRALDIVVLGREGDGIAHEAGGTVFVPFALPGERVVPERPFPRIVRPSPLRVSPPCDLFGECGGCAIQHLDAAAGLAWKTGRVVDALRMAGFEVGAPDGLHQSPPRSRRRIDLAVRRVGGDVLIGLHRRGGAPVDMTVCEVLHPRLLALLAPLREVLRRLPGLSREASALLTLLDSGPDLLLRGIGALDAGTRRKLAEFAAAHGIARIASAPGKVTDAGGAETACQLGPVRHVLSGRAIAPAPGAFLQASVAGEAAIVAAVVAGLPDRLRARGRVFDLFAGCGTLSFPLAGLGKVLAYEGDADAAATLAAGAGGTRVQAMRRDLVRQPVLASEIGPTDVVVLDPPFAGAAVQMRQLAQGKPARIVYVSCNPERLGEDAALLAPAGYRLARLEVIDQFLWSSHVESVATFTRPGR